MLDKSVESNDRQQSKQIGTEILSEQFSTLGMSFELSPSGLSQALGEKGLAHDLTQTMKLLRGLYEKIRKGLESGQISSAEARGFSAVYHQFASQINPSSSKKAAQRQRAIHQLGNAIYNRMQEHPQLTGTEKGLYHSALDLLRIAKDMGFRNIHTREFTDREGQKEKYYVMYREDGLLLTMETFLGNHVNHADLYFNYDLTPGHNLRFWEGWGGGLHSHIIAGKEPGAGETWISIMHVDARQELRSRIETLEEHGKFLPKWVERPYLSLATRRDYDDQTVNGKGGAFKQGAHGTLNRQREMIISEFPEEVRTAITPEPRQEKQAG